MARLLDDHRQLKPRAHSRANTFKALAPPPPGAGVLRGTVETPSVRRYQESSQHGPEIDPRVARGPGPLRGGAGGGSRSHTSNRVARGVVGEPRGHRRAP